MPSGLQLFNPDTGLVRLDLTTHVGRFLGTFYTPGPETGTHTDTRIIGNRFFYIGFGTPNEPEVTANTSTGVITWSYTVVKTGAGGAVPPGPNERMYTVYYGVY